jgi:hypothetical protein
VGLVSVAAVSLLVVDQPRIRLDRWHTGGGFFGAVSGSGLSATGHGALGLSGVMGRLGALAERPKGESVALEVADQRWIRVEGRRSFVILGQWAILGRCCRGS